MMPDSEHTTHRHSSSCVVIGDRMSHDGGVGAVGFGAGRVLGFMVFISYIVKRFTSCVLRTDRGVTR